MHVFILLLHLAATPVDLNFCFTCYVTKISAIMYINFWISSFEYTIYYYALLQSFKPPYWKQHLIGTSWWRLKRTQQQRPFSTSPRRPKQVSNETSNGVSVVRHQDFSVVPILDDPLVRLYEVSCKSQMKVRK